MKNDQSTKAKVIIAGGGTGGHVFAGVAIAEAWIEKFSKDRSQILFVGAKGGVEEKTVARAGFDLKLLNLGPLNGVSFLTRLSTLGKIPRAFFDSTCILLKMRPQAVVGVGGYASGPLVFMARILGGLWGCSISILEQNVVPGFTNRILGKMAHQVLYAFPIPGVPSEQVTGNPIRKNMVAQPSAERKPFVIFVFGGSQGAQGMSTLVVESLKYLQGFEKDIHLIHQTGERDFERVTDLYSGLSVSHEVHRFIHDMLSMYHRSSLVICRSGSSTLAELAAVRRGSILVPFPFASDNHQEKNARVFEDKNAAVVMPQFKTTPEQLAGKIIELIQNPIQVSEMEQAVSLFSRPNAAQSIVTAISKKVRLK